MSTNPESVIYVSPQGSDSWSGSLPDPMPDGTDGPFATLPRARDACRALPANSPRRIVVRGGTYYDVSLTLEPVDSGLTLEAMAGETPVLNGGHLVTGWVRDTEDERFWVAALPEVGRGEWDFRMLQVNGRFCQRARLPWQGAFSHRSEFPVRWMSTSLGGWERKPTAEELTTLKFHSDDLGAWLDTRNAELTIYHAWDDSMVGVKSVDFETATITFSNPAGHPAGAFADWNPHARTYVVWNVRQGMSEPGQWYLDRTRGRVVYWSLPGEDMRSAEVIAPTSNCIIHLHGTDGAPLTDINLRGLTLAVTTTPLIAGDFAAENLPGAITSRGALHDICMEGLTIRNVGGHGIKLRGEDNRHIVIEHCEIAMTGAGGVYLTADDSAIRENLIAFDGMTYPAAIGVFFSGNHNVVSHNDVHDTSYTGIDGSGSGHRIEYNDFARVMRVLNDGAAIYTIFAKDTILRGNAAHDIGGGPGARHAYYLDEQSERCVVEDNLAVGVPWPLHNHMSRNNTIRHNLCIVEGDAKITFPRGSNFCLQDNIIVASGSIRFVGVEAITQLNRNIFFSATGQVDGIALDDYAETDRITHLSSTSDTLLADPLLADAAHGDYHFLPQSPAHQLGIAPFDFSLAGRTRFSSK